MVALVLKRWCVPAVLACLTACTPSLLDYEARVHVVQPGDTLYTIAWRHGADYRDLARWNGLSNPDVIYAGQRLRLVPPAGSVAPATAPPPTGSRPAAGGRPAASGPAPARTAPAVRPSDPEPRWQWPVAGPIDSAFGAASGIGSGIGIGGQVGQPIRAAAAGDVVYAGSGLIGYGQLVIVKHNDTYLSAYGYNSRVLVAQGQAVERGETIAEMGFGPERQPRLHFEIRRNGSPLDPLGRLPSAR